MVSANAWATSSAWTWCSSLEPEVWEDQFFTASQSLEYLGIKMAGWIQRFPAWSDNMPRVQNRGGKCPQTGFPQQIFFDGGFSDPIVTKGLSRRFFGGRNLGTGSMDPDCATMKKMLNLATKSLHQMVRTFEGEADQIDHDIRPQVTDLLSEIPCSFFC